MIIWAAYGYLSLHLPLNGTIENGNIPNVLILTPHTITVHVYNVTCQYNDTYLNVQASYFMKTILAYIVDTRL